MESKGQALEWAVYLFRKERAANTTKFTAASAVCSQIKKICEQFDDEDVQDIFIELLDLEEIEVQKTKI